MPRRNLQFQQEQAGHMLTSWWRGEVALIVESAIRDALFVGKMLRACHKTIPAPTANIREVY
jgi:hypothetical protein